MLDQPQPKKPHVVDVRVGSLIRMQRKLRGMSQTILAEGLGVSFQQVQKYEKGINRVGSSRLQAIADILGVPVASFFETSLGDQLSSPQSLSYSASEEIMEFLRSRDGVALNRAFIKIKDGRVRWSIIELTKAIAIEPSE